MNRGRGDEGRASSQWPAPLRRCRATAAASALPARSVHTASAEIGCDASWHGAVRAAFRQEHCLQCGFLHAGMVMAAVGLLAENPILPRPRFVRAWGNRPECVGATRSSSSGANDWAIGGVAAAGGRIAMADIGPVPLRAHEPRDGAGRGHTRRWRHPPAPGPRDAANRDAVIRRPAGSATGTGARSRRRCEPQRLDPACARCAQAGPPRR